MIELESLIGNAFGRNESARTCDVERESLTKFNLKHTEPEMRCSCLQVRRNFRTLALFHMRALLSPLPGYFLTGRGFGGSEQWAIFLRPSSRPLLMSTLLVKRHHISENVPRNNMEPGERKRKESLTCHASNAGLPSPRQCLTVSYIHSASQGLVSHLFALSTWIDMDRYVWDRLAAPGSDW